MNILVFYDRVEKQKYMGNIGEAIDDQSHIYEGLGGKGESMGERQRHEGLGVAKLWW